MACTFFVSIFIRTILSEIELNLAGTRGHKADYNSWANLGAKGW